MMLEPISSSKVATPVGPFSLAIRDDDRVYTSGQVAQDPKTGRLIEGGVAAQTEHFAPPYPARTTVAVVTLPLGAAVEIDVIAR